MPLRFTQIIHRLSLGARIIRDSHNSSGTPYRFTAEEKRLGARLRHLGYPHLPSITNDEPVPSDQRSITIEGETLLVPYNLFRPGELEFIWAEVFTPLDQNPHCYESEDVRIRAGDVVLDAGACEGFFTLFALRRDASRIHALEPEPRLAASLRATFADNKSVQVSETGLAAKTGSARFALGEEYGCTAKIDEQGSDTIQTLTLDDFVTNNSLTRLDFVKMDVEDHEVDAIRGASETLRSLKPRLAIAVYHNHGNALAIKKLIQETAPAYRIRFGGCFVHERPYRPYMLYGVHPNQD